MLNKRHLKQTISISRVLSSVMWCFAVPEKADSIIEDFKASCVFFPSPVSMIYKRMKAVYKWCFTL